MLGAPEAAPSMRPTANPPDPAAGQPLGCLDHGARLGPPRPVDQNQVARGVGRSVNDGNACSSWGCNRRGSGAIVGCLATALRPSHRGLGRNRRT